MSFLLTFLASISTLFGSFLIFIKKKTDNIIICSLAFAAGVMITVSITDLIPESYNLLTSIYNNFYSILLILIFINIGIIISMIIDKYLPNNNDLYRVGIVSMIAIILHNVPEGVITFITSSKDITLGITLALAIAAHNIPEGITISLPIYYATGNRKKALFYTFISGISEFFGAIIAFLFLKPIVNNTNLGLLFSIIAGIMIHISFYELLPLSFKYKKNKLSILFLLLGSLFIIITHFIFN